MTRIEKFKMKFRTMTYALTLTPALSHPMGEGRGEGQTISYFQMRSKFSKLE